jgi:hypothetical protein
VKISTFPVNPERSSPITEPIMIYEDYWPFASKADFLAALEDPEWKNYFDLWREAGQ